MSRHILLASGSFVALTIAASFFGASPAMAQVNCTSSDGTTLPGAVSSGSTITCTGTTSSTTTISNSPSANNVTVVLANSASVTTSVIGAPNTFTMGNNASLTVNSGASLTSSGLGKSGNAFSAGTGLQALILSGGTVNGTISAGAGSHVTVAGTVTQTGGANAITLTGDGNTVTLNPGFSMTNGGGGALVVGGTAGATATTLELGGTGTGTFDVSAIGSTTGYTNFALFLKSGTSSWTLLNTPTQAATPWTITGGTLSIASDASLDTANSTLTLNGGTLAVTATTTSARPFTVGSGGFDVAAGQTYTVSGVISGTGALNLTDSGTMLLTGINTYSGGTNVSGGTLQLGTGGTLGSGVLSVASGATMNFNSISGTVNGLSGAGSVVLGSATLTSNQSTNTTFTGAISGTGKLVKSGSGTLTINGTNSFTGGTTVTAGTLAGTGKIGALTVSGGTLSPGSGTAGTFTTGNLSLASSSTSVFGISPTSNTSLTVNGTAAVGGTLVANAASGSYSFNQKYTLITATGGLSGTFATLSTSGLSAAFLPQLSYDANDVYLTLRANALTPLLPSNATGNQKAVAGGIDAAIKGGANLPNDFLGLFNQSGSGLTSALNQLTGEIHGDAGQAASQSFAPFLALLMGSGDFANGSTDTASADPLSGVHPAQASLGPMKVWAAAYGGNTNFGAQPVSGAQPLSSTVFGGVVGLEQNFDDILAGLSVGFGQNQFALSGNQSQGTSTDIMLGGYARTPILDAGYLSGALAYGFHNMTTQRVVTVASTEILRGHFTAGDFGGRAEGGYNLGLDEGYVLTPYAAIAGNSLSLPAYQESATSGPSSFALAYAAQSYGLLHTELGGRLSQNYIMGSDTLAAEIHAAWSHQFVDNTATNASFQSLTGSGFAVSGALIPRESADLGAGLKITGASGFSGGARVDSQLGGGFTAVSGSINFGYSW